MGRQIVKQPNGRFCVFSSVCDNVIYYDCTKEDIKDYYLEESKKEIDKQVDETIESLELDGKPYYQFTKSFPDMLKIIKEVHGKKEQDKIKGLIN
jgi:hypothetical protein